MPLWIPVRGELPKRVLRALALSGAEGQSPSPTGSLLETELVRVRQVVQRPDLADALVGALLVEPMGAREARVAPEEQALRATRHGVSLRYVEQCMAETAAVAVRMDVDAADFPSANSTRIRPGGDHADDRALLFRHPQRAGIIAGKRVKFLHFGIDVDDDARVLRPADGNQTDQAVTVFVPALPDRRLDGQRRPSQKVWMRRSPSSKSSSAVAVLIRR